MDIFADDVERKIKVSRAGLGLVADMERELGGLIGIDMERELERLTGMDTKRELGGLFVDPRRELEEALGPRPMFLEDHYQRLMEIDPIGRWQLDVPETIMPAPPSRLTELEDRVAALEDRVAALEEEPRETKRPRIGFGR